MAADFGEHLSVAMQFAASFCWAIGAGIAGPADAADYLQFFAAIFWCVANLCSAWSLGWLGCSSAAAEKGGAKEVEIGSSSVRRLLTEEEEGKQNGGFALEKGANGV